jgi:cardiolipin synthase
MGEEIRSTSVMEFFRWAIEHHLQSVFIDLLVFWFAASVLRHRRPTGSAFAWLLAIILIPYLGIPCYLMFGGRKFQLKANSKSDIPVPADAHDPDPFSAPGLAGAHGLGKVECADKIDWLDDGVHAYEAFLSEILAARKSIRIATFLLRDDATGLAIVEALARRARDGVEVRLLLDDFLRFEAPRNALARLRAAGGRVESFMPLVHIPFRGQANLRNHRKLAIFDGSRAITGGMNLANHYMGQAADPSRWRDLSILLSGQGVATLDGIFRADWQFASGEVLAPAAPAPAAGPVPICIVPSGPDSASDPIYDAMLTLIFRAQRRFWVCTPYFVPDEPLSRALSVAARRGVDVMVIVPNRSNHALADLVGGQYLRDLAEAGVRVRRVPRMLHAKAVLMDDIVAAVGSANFDMRSLFLDYEVSVFLTGAAEIHRMNDWFEQTAKDAAEGPAEAGRIRRVLETGARLFAPLI